MTRTIARFAFPAPRQITLALDARGLEGPEVDEACGVAEPVVDLWEAGVLLPTTEQVARLSRLTGQTPPFFYERVAAPAGRMFVCGRRKEYRSVVEAGELGSPVCPRCGAVCWLKVPAKTGGAEVLLEGPDPDGALIMCVVGRTRARAPRRLIWGVRKAGKDERDEEHLLRAVHVCRQSDVVRPLVEDTGLFSRPE
jgi:hypothetical protein